MFFILPSAFWYHHFTGNPRCIAPNHITERVGVCLYFFPIKVPVTNCKSELWYIMSTYFVSVFVIFRLNFGTFPTVWYFCFVFYFIIYIRMRLHTVTTTQDREELRIIPFFKLSSRRCRDFLIPVKMQIFHLVFMMHFLNNLYEVRSNSQYWKLNNLKVYGIKKKNSKG